MDAFYQSLNNQIQAIDEGSDDEVVVDCEIPMSHNVIRSMSFRLQRGSRSSVIQSVDIHCLSLVTSDKARSVQALGELLQSLPNLTKLGFPICDNAWPSNISANDIMSMVEGCESIENLVFTADNLWDRPLNLQNPTSLRVLSISIGTQNTSVFLQSLAHAPHIKVLDVVIRWEQFSTTEMPRFMDGICNCLENLQELSLHAHCLRPFWSETSVQRGLANILREKELKTLTMCGFEVPQDIGPDRILHPDLITALKESHTLETVELYMPVEITLGAMPSHEMVSRVCQALRQSKSIKKIDIRRLSVPVPSVLVSIVQSVSAIQNLETLVLNVKEDSFYYLVRSPLISETIAAIATHLFQNTSFSKGVGNVLALIPPEMLEWWLVRNDMIRNATKTLEPQPTSPAASFPLALLPVALETMWKRTNGDGNAIRKVLLGFSGQLFNATGGVQSRHSRSRLCPRPVAKRKKASVTRVVGSPPLTRLRRKKLGPSV